MAALTVRAKLHGCAGSGTLHLDLYFLGQPGIVSAEANQNFLTTEVMKRSRRG